jgi:hypothetical protein
MAWNLEPGHPAVSQPVEVQPVPLMYTNHLQQQFIVSLSEEMDISNSTVACKYL